jgi:hypothetical protein
LIFSDQKYMIGNEAANQIIVSQPCSLRISLGSPWIDAQRLCTIISTYAVG